MGAETANALRILVTRPEPDASAFARELTAVGAEAVIAPLLEISFSEGRDPDFVPDLEGVQALLFTSANGVRALAKLGAVPGLPVLAVGDATAQAAKEAGFGDVASADGDVDDLARLVGERLDPAAGPLVHVAGSAVAGDLSGALTAVGFTVRREVLYAVEMAKNLPAAAADALRNGSVDGVAMFSPRTGAAFVSLVQQAGLETTCAKLTAYCLSANVKAAVRDLPWGAVRVAARPETAALVDAISGR